LMHEMHLSVLHAWALQQRLVFSCCAPQHGLELKVLAASLC